MLVAEGLYDRVPRDAAIAATGRLFADESGDWLTYPGTPAGMAAVGRAVGAVPLFVASSDLRQSLAQETQMCRVRGRWDGTLLRAESMAIVPDWPEVTPRTTLVPMDEATAVIETIPAELKDDLMAVWHAHPEPHMTSAIQIAIPLATPAWRDWATQHRNLVELFALVEVLD